MPLVFFIGCHLIFTDISHTSYQCPTGFSLTEFLYHQDEQFLDKEGGAYYITPEGDPSILFRMKEDYDGAEPSGNSVAAINLLRLSSLVTGDLAESFHTTAEHLLVSFLF